MTTRSILLKNRPTGKPDHSHFEFVESEVPSLENGQVLLESKYISVDPYLRGRMNDGPSYIPPFEVGKPIVSMIVAEVKESKDDDILEGDHVMGMLDWKELQVADASSLRKVDPNLAPLSAYLGVLGLTGMTAYLGLKKIGKPEDGETLLVSGAAGAVGSTVGQIGKIMGLRVVGTAGSDEKVNMIQEKFGFDAGINYKTTNDLKKAISETCPDGVDVYFENVGGELFEAVLYNINKHARIVVCGAISIYNNTEIPKVLDPHPFLIKKSALMQGFTIRDYESDFPGAIQQLGQWLKEGKLTYEETIVEGFDQTPQAFLDLFEGKNKGKMVVSI